MREMVATVLVGAIGGMLGATLILKLKSPTPAELADRIDEISRRVDGLSNNANVHSAEFGEWYCTPGFTCGRTDEGCAPKCQRRKVVYCGGDFGVACYADLSKCLAYNAELQRRPDPDVRMCIGVQ